MARKVTESRDQVAVLGRTLNEFPTVDGGEYEVFMRQAPVFERMFVSDGIDLMKFWCSSVSADEHRSRFGIRQVDRVS